MFVSARNVSLSRGSHVAGSIDKHRERVRPALGVADAKSAEKSRIDGILPHFDAIGLTPASHVDASKRQRRSSPARTSDSHRSPDALPKEAAESAGSAQVRH